MELNQQPRKRSSQSICPLEKNHLRVLRDPLGHRGLWILLGQEKKGKAFFCLGKEEERSQREVGQGHPLCGQSTSHSLNESKAGVALGPKDILFRLWAAPSLPSHGFLQLY